MIFDARNEQAIYTTTYSKSLWKSSKILSNSQSAPLTAAGPPAMRRRVAGAWPPRRRAAAPVPPPSRCHNRCCSIDAWHTRLARTRLVRTRLACTRLVRTPRVREPTDPPMGPPTQLLVAVRFVYLQQEIELNIC